MNSPGMTRRIPHPSPHVCPNLQFRRKIYNGYRWEGLETRRTTLHRWTEFPVVRRTFYARHSIQTFLHRPSCSLLEYGMKAQRQTCLPSFDRVFRLALSGGEREQHRVGGLYLVICAGGTFGFTYRWLAQPQVARIGRMTPCQRCNAPGTLCIMCLLSKYE